MRAETKPLTLLGVLLLVLLAFVGFGYLQQQQAALQKMAAATIEYDGEINGSWVKSIPEIGVATAGTLDNTKTQLTLSFMPGDISLARNVRPAYFVIKIDGRVKDIKVEGDKVSDAIKLSVDEDYLGIVYSDPKEAKDVLAVEKDVEKDGDFELRIPVDTAVMDVDELYVGMKFVLLEEPSSTVHSTKIYDIKVEADKADKDADEFALTVYAQYNVTS